MSFGVDQVLKLNCDDNLTTLLILKTIVFISNVIVSRDRIGALDSKSEVSLGYTEIVYKHE